MERVKNGNYAFASFCLGLVSEACLNRTHFTDVVINTGLVQFGLI